MKASIIITGSGSILALTSCDDLGCPEFAETLRKKGMNKYIAFEVPVDLVKSRYGKHYSIIMADRKQPDVLRIVDVDGHRIFRNFNMSDLSGPIFYETPEIMHKAA
jgi:hypothetical protein